MDNGVHIYTVPLHLSAGILSDLAASLSADEMEQAARFKFERHRNRFIAARGALRHILADWLETEPSEVEFSYGPNGKPGLAKGSCGSALEFNLSHAEDLALVAVSFAAPVGVDVEQVRRLPDFKVLVTRFFATNEARVFTRLPLEAQPTAFFNLWTRKEAWLKATGEGIAHSLHLVEVSFLPLEPARLVNLPRQLGDAANWTLKELEPAGGFVGAVAVAVPNPRFVRHRWDPLTKSPMVANSGSEVGV